MFEEFDRQGQEQKEAEAKLRKAPRFNKLRWQKRIRYLGVQRLYSIIP